MQINQPGIQGTKEHLQVLRWGANTPTQGKVENGLISWLLMAYVVCIKFKVVDIYNANGLRHERTGGGKIN